MYLRLKKCKKSGIIQLYCNWRCNGGGGQIDKVSELQVDYKGVPIPSAQKAMARPGIEPRSPAYMADALTAELLTTPAEMSAETMTDGSALNC